MIKVLKTIYFIVLFLLMSYAAQAAVVITTQKSFVNDSYGSMDVAGTCSRTDGVGYRLDENGVPVTGHTGLTLDADTSGNVFSGVITGIPSGKYTIVVYHLLDTDDYDISDVFGCGFVWARSGQSNQAQNAYGGTFNLTPNDNLWKWVRDLWVTAGEPYNSGELTYGDEIDEGMGDVPLGNLLVETLGKPVLIVNTSYSGAPITYWEAGASPDVLDRLLDDVEEITGVRDCHAIDFLQGEYEASNNYSETYYETHLQTVIDRFESQTHANIPFIIMEIGKVQSGMGAWYAAGIRNAEKDIASANSHVLLSASNVQRPLIDFAHWEHISRPNASMQAGYAYLWSIGKANGYRGSVCVSREAVSAFQTRFRFLHPSASDFASFTSDGNGFSITDITPTNFVSITSVVKENANQILVNHGELHYNIGYFIGMEAGTPYDYTNWLHDNSSYVAGGFPMIANVRIPAYVADAVSPNITITTNGGDDYESLNQTAVISGTSDDNIGVALVKWSNSATGEIGECHGTTSWTAYVPLQYAASNEITISAWDAAINTASDTITINVYPSTSLDAVLISEEETTTSLDAVFVGSWFGITGDTATCLGGDSEIINSVGLKNGSLYKITYQVETYTSGNLYLDGAFNDLLLSNDIGTHAVYVECTDNTQNTIFRSDGWIGSMDLSNIKISRAKVRP